MTGAKYLKSTQLAFAVLILLAAAGCHRQAGNASAANALADGGATQENSGPPHDPHAMTAIDVATGDLAGFASYAGGRTYAPPASHTAGVPVATTTLPTLPLASVAAGDDQVGEQPSAVPGPAPWGVPAGGGPAPPSNAPAGQTAP
jgi:hypothetical protein